MPRMSSKAKSDAVELPRRYAAALRRLKRGVGTREALQTALETSEQHHRLLLEKSRHLQTHLRRLSHELLFAQEEERRRISRELHDEIGEALTAVNVKLAALELEAKINTAGVKKHIASARRLVERSMDTVHRFARELRPPLLDDLGLIPALQSYANAFTKRTRIPIHVTVFAEVERLHSAKRTVLYRVAQEALSNVARHARASLVNVSIRRSGDVVRMEIHDNGKSFQVERALFAKRISRLGLLGMRERVEMVGGSFAVESAPKTGTTIRAEIPFRKGIPASPGARAGSAQ